MELVTNPYPVSANPLDRDDADGIAGLMLDKPWSDDIFAFMQEHRVEGLYLNGQRGWNGKDYRFLSEISWLRLLHLVTFPISDLSAIESLSNLEHLTISSHVSGKVDFSNQKKLRTFQVFWWPGAASVFECNSLRSAYFDKMDRGNFENLARLRGLRKLTVGNSPIKSLRPILELESLEKLELLNCCQLESIEGIERLRHLRQLSIRGSKNVSDLSSIGELSELEVLNLDDSGIIASLRPFRRLTKLRALSFSGRTTNVADGDLRPLERLSQLSMLMFSERKDYSHNLVKRWNWNNFYQPDKLLEEKDSN